MVKVVKRLERSGAKYTSDAMAAIEPLVDLKSRLEKSLSEIGYSGKVGRLPAAVEKNEKLMRFVSWVIDNVTPENHLTTEELEKFEELKSSNSVLEGEALDNALVQLGPVEHGWSEETMAREVEGMREEVTAFKTQLHTLNSIRKKMSDHYAAVVGERDKLLQQKAEAQHSYQKNMERGKEDNKKVNSSLEELSSSVKEVCTFHHGEGAGQGKATPTFLSSIPQDSYHKTEDDYLAELTAYTKKQFQGIATLVQSNPDDTAQFSEVDLGDSEQVLLRGVTEDQHKKHCHELARLQALYPLTEMQCINAQLSEQHALAACQRAEEELAAMEQGDEEMPLDHGKLRHQLKIQQERLSELRAQIQELGESQVPDLLQDMATLQISKVLHGDYDLKIARQDYFTSKQDKVIEYLRSQQARQELLSMLYEVELRRHRETHRLFSATEKQLSQWKEEREKRSQAMQNPAIQPVTTAKQTVDSRDKTAQRLCTLLGVEPSSSTPLVTYSSLHEAVKQLVHQLTTLQALVSSHSSEFKQLLTDQESLTENFELTLFGDSGEQPILTIKEYEEEHSKLVSVVTTMEQNIKALLKDFDSKKKILQANPLMETERKLFVYFFTSPGKLRQVVSELAHRIDALATANTVATS